MYTLEQIMARRAELNKENAEIGAQVSDENAKGLTNEQLRSLKQRQETVLAELRELELAEIKLRSSAQSMGNPIAAQPDERSNTLDIGSLSYREKVGLVLARRWLKRPISDVEKRELGKALTTTDAVFVAASEMVDGVNNAGVFIGTTLLLDLLREEKKLSPILEDIAFTRIKGLTKFPYRKGRDKARFKHEGRAGKDNQIEFATLYAKTGYLQTIFVVSDEALAQSEIDLGQYLLTQILEDLGEDWAEQLIYASGTGDEFNGLLVGQTDQYPNGYDIRAMKVIEAMIKALPSKYRKGAKIYLAQDVYDDIFFEADNVGNFKYPVINNSSGIFSIGRYRVAVDENLYDGDIVFGNVAKYFKANILISTRVEPDRTPRNGTTEYVASTYCATASLAGAFVYAHRKE